MILNAMSLRKERRALSRKLSLTILGKQELLNVFKDIIPTDFNSAQKKTYNKHVGIIIDLYRKYVRYLTVLESTQEIDELDTAIQKYWYR